MAKKIDELSADTAPELENIELLVTNFAQISSFRCRSALDRVQKMKKGAKIKNPDTAAELWFENYDYPINMAIFEHLGSRS